MRTILRNQQFLANSDIGYSKGKDWQIVANNLPEGTYRFWVSNGHSKTVLFVLALQSGQQKLYRSASPIRRSQSIQPTQWPQLNVQGNLLEPEPFPDSQILTGATLGPVFVNPYNPTQLYVLTTLGVMYSNTGGFDFSLDQSLTNLLNGNGTYKMTGNFTGDFSSHVDFDNSYVSASMGTLSALSFNRQKPNERVAASPFTGVFYSAGNSVWTDLSGYLPTPRTSISDVAIVGDDLYIATEGRGLLRMEQFRPVLKLRPRRR
jgi:hypothetical protein